MQAGVHKQNFIVCTYTEGNQKLCRVCLLEKKQNNQFITEKYRSFKNRIQEYSLFRYRYYFYLYTSINILVCNLFNTIPSILFAITFILGFFIFKLIQAS